MERNDRFTKTDKDYEISVQLNSDSLEILLVPLLPGPSTQFLGSYTDHTLNNQLIDKFGGVQNIYALLQTPSNYVVRLEEGQIELKLSYELPNKKKITHKGTLELTPIPKKESAKGQPQFDEMLAIIGGLRGQMREIKESFNEKQQFLKSEIQTLKQKLREESFKRAQEIESCRQMMTHCMEMLENSKQYLEEVKKQNKRESENKNGNKLEKKLEEVYQKVESQGKKFVAIDNEIQNSKLDLKVVKDQLKDSRIKMKNLSDSALQKKTSEKSTCKTKLNEVHKVKTLQMHPGLLYSNQFQFIQKNRVHFVGSQKSPTQFLLKPFTSQYSMIIVTFKVLKSFSDISIGIIDSEYVGQKCIKGNKQPNYIRYNGQFGSLYEGGKLVYEEGEEYGFKKGQQVQMVVQFDEGWIQWWVDKEARIKHNSEKIKNNEIDWVPHFVLGNKGDMIELIPTQ